jgi:hypothetical protein
MDMWEFQLGVQKLHVISANSEMVFHKMTFSEIEMFVFLCNVVILGWIPEYH